MSSLVPVCGRISTGACGRCGYFLFGVASDRSYRGGNLVRVTEFERIHAYLSLKCTTETRGMGEYAVPQLNGAIQMAETAVHGVKADS